MIAVDISRRTALAALTAIVAIGAVLRWWEIGREALWGDEALTAVIAHYPAFTLWTKPVDPTGPLYYLVHAAFVPPGSSAAVARMPSLIAGLVTIVATYGLGRTVASRFAGVTAAGLVAGSAGLIEYAQEARGYSLLVALVTLSAWMLALLFGPQSERRRYAIAAAYLASSVAAASAHLIGSLWVVSSVAGLALAVRNKQDHLSRREAVAIVVIGALLMIPEVRRLALFAFGNNNFNWLAPGTLFDLGRLVALQWVPFAHRTMAVASIVAVAGVALAMWTGRARSREWASSRPLQIVIPALLIAQAPLVWLVGETVTPILMYRTILQAIPGAAVMLALIVSWQSSRVRVVLALVLFAVTTLSAVDQGLVQPKPPWRAAAQRTSSADLVLLCPGWQAPAFLAASRPGDVWSWVNGKAALATARSDADPAAWSKAYFDRIHTRRDTASVPDPSGFQKVAVVMAGCSEDEQAAIAQWLATRGFRPGGATTLRPARREVVELENGVSEITVRMWTAAPRQIEP